MSPPTRRPLILFVDDEPDVVDILSRTFDRRYDVLTATSAMEALALLAKHPVDLLVTDQKMPDVTGIELVAKARAAGHDVTAILLTGYTDPQDLIDAINKGQVYRYVTKPWDVTDLTLTVKNAVDHHLLRRDRERLTVELRKRVDALSVFSEVTQGGALSSYDAIIERVVQSFAKILPFEIGAALVAVDRGSPVSLKLNCQSEAGEAALLRAKELTLAAFRHATGESLAEDRVVVRVTGKRSLPPVNALADDVSKLEAPLYVDGRVAGVILLLSSKKGAFTESDAGLLSVLANQTAEAIRNLTAVLGAERRRVERMVECLADGVILTDAKNELVVINPAARALLHIDSDDKANNKYLQEVLGFYPFDLVRGWEYGGTQSLREEVKIFDRTLHSTVTPVTDAQGALAGVAVVLRDITDQKVLDERKEEFVSIISHELRTPLTSISGALDLVLNHIAGDINEKQQRFLSMAKDSCEKLNGIVDDLLDLSKYAKGKLRMSFEMVWVNELVRSAVERYQAAALEKRIELAVRMPDSPVKVLADAGRLTQVLNNLLTNAIKFTPQGGRIALDLYQPRDVKGFVGISCWNNGEAIAEADLERIFDKFEQARSVRTRTVRGTGLGLAICRSIVEAHGGNIWAESSEGAGARFVVVLPTEPAPEIIAGEQPEAKPAPVSERRSTILVVDDDPDVAFTLKAMLLSRGHRVLTSNDSDEALSLARRNRPDLVILDVRMPGLDGLGLAEIMRHDPETRGAQILVISGGDERGRAFKSGVNAFLQKPIDLDRFHATVDGLISEKRGGKKAKVLVVDDDASIRAICAEVLQNLGYGVLEAATAQAARSLIREEHPEVLLLDVILPDGDGFTLLEELKSERAASHMSVIFISAKSETASKVRALKLGGDDYLVKPFDAIELAARVERVLRRKEAELGASPTTRLPGSAAIEREVLRRFEEHKPFALCYLDLDNLKAYNDHYGYAKADGVVLQTGDLLREVVSNEGGPGDFIGHIAGDDFVFITTPDRVQSLCQKVIDAFDRIIPLYYDKLDRERGYIDAEDRYGQRRRFPVMSVSVVAILNDGRYRHHSELARVAADLKKKAKSLPASKFLRSDNDAVFPSNTRVQRAAAEALAEPVVRPTGSEG